MLTHIRCYDRIAFCNLIQFFYNIRTGERILIIFERILFFKLSDMIRPLLIGPSLYLGVQHSENFLYISDDACIRFNVLVDLGGIDIYMKDFCLGCKLTCVTDDPVGKSCTYRYEKIALAHAEV